MQLPHCYDVVSGRESPFNHVFDTGDWASFEHLQDTKCHFSEGYGAKNSGLYSVPWTDAALRVLSRLNGRHGAGLPLQIGFTHLGKVLYLCCLLGICYEKDWQPSVKRVDAYRQWRVALLAPCLGHVGIEKYVGNSEQERLRIIVNVASSIRTIGRLETSTWCVVTVPFCTSQFHGAREQPSLWPVLRVSRIFYPNDKSTPYSPS